VARHNRLSGAGNPQIFDSESPVVSPQTNRRRLRSKRPSGGMVFQRSVRDPPSKTRPTPPTQLGRVLLRERANVRTLGGTSDLSTTTVFDASESDAAIAADLHHLSLEALDGTGVGSLFEALSWAFPASTPELGRVDLTAVHISPEGYWHAQATASRWVRPIRCVISTQCHALYFELDSVPWLCDERATATSTDRPEFSVGGHRGLYLGLPLVPRLQLVPRPGLRRASRARRLSWVLVPDIGSPVTFSGGPRMLEVRFGTRRRAMVDPSLLSEILAEGAAGDPDEFGLSRGSFRRLKSLGRDGGARGRRFSPAALSAIDDALGLSNPTWTERVLGLADHALANRAPEPQRLVEELSHESLEYRPYGDILRRVIARGALRGLQDYLEAESDLAARYANAPNSGDLGLLLLRRLAARLKTRAQAAIDETIRSGSPGAVVATADDRGTVAAIEAQRTITRYGPAGERRRGASRLWLRGLHPDRRGEICPLLTPESEDLGLIRGAALGAVASSQGLHASGYTSQHDDLSVAAALIPFINHDDPTRASIAARLLRQAVPIQGAHRPRVETDVADRIASEHGVVRTHLAGEVVDLGRNWVEIESADRRKRVVVGFGPAMPSTSAVDGSWRPLVKVGDSVYTGELLAAAPDVVITDDAPHLAQGRDCLVAYTPWYGWNFEDAIVVSSAIADEFTSFHYVRSRERLDLVRGELPSFVVKNGSRVKAGDALVQVSAGGRLRRTIGASAEGTVTILRLERDDVLVELRVDRPLAVGDKLTNRHGAKGVVAAILPDNEMPRLPDGRHVEMILNPLGVIRRLNLSQLFETHVTLRAYLSKSISTQIVDRRVASVEELAQELAELGAPGGRLPLCASDGSPIGGPEGVVVGWQQILKLDHLASNKERSRLAGDRSPVTQQPSKGSTWVAGYLVGGAQRLGEMELWAMQAVSADLLVRDAQRRSDHGGLSMEAVAAHLRIGGLRVTWDDEGGPSVWRDVDGGGLADLPAEVVNAIEEPRLTTGEGNSVQDPLHDHHHGLDEESVRCACGETTSAGAVCATCGTRTRLNPGAERGTFKYRIRLAMPVRHPWAPDDPSWTLHSIALLPPAFRPYNQNHLDQAYRRLIIENARVDCEPNRGVRRLEVAVAELLGAVDDPPSAESIAARLQGKRGLLRRALRGRDTDYAARGVMVPDPTRDPETIGIPHRAAHTLGLELDGDQVVLVNRQPTLLPTNLVALKPEVVEGSAFQIHPLLCARLAGDFDGDEVTVHRPVSAEASRVAWGLFRPAMSYRHVANNQPMSKSDLDVALGLWLLGQKPGGRASLATRLGLAPDDPIVGCTGPITANEKDELVRAVTGHAATGREALEAMTALFGAGVEAASGWSFSALELLDVANQVDALRLVETVPADSALGEAVGSGQAGKPKGLTQLLIKRGSLEGFDGQPTPSAEQSFLVGLDDTDYFATAPGGLRALSDKKLMTPLAGGLTKSLIEAVYDVVISEEHCGSVRTGFGAILTCATADGVCARCYGASGGYTTALGARVGLLAAFAIGERSTQNAMKAFQGGTTLVVGGNLRRLRSLLGEGRIVRDGGQDTTLSDIMAASVSSSDELVTLYEPLLAAVDECLDGLVRSHHLEVVWRRLRAAHEWSDTRNRPLAAAQWPGSAFVHATTRGNLYALVRSVDTSTAQDQTPSSLRLAVIQGGC
jgi:hypothetical protein